MCVPNLRYKLTRNFSQEISVNFSYCNYNSRLLFFLFPPIITNKSTLNILNKKERNVANIARISQQNRLNKVICYETIDSCNRTFFDGLSFVFSIMFVIKVLKRSWPSPRLYIVLIVAVRIVIYDMPLSKECMFDETMLKHKFS